MHIKLNQKKKRLRLRYSFSPVPLNQNSNSEISSSPFGLQNLKALLKFTQIQINYWRASSQPHRGVLRPQPLIADTRLCSQGPPLPPISTHSEALIHFAGSQAVAPRVRIKEDEVAPCSQMADHLSKLLRTMDNLFSQNNKYEKPLEAV